jgi:hypothetical protein
VRDFRDGRAAICGLSPFDGEDHNDWPGLETWGEMLLQYGGGEAVAHHHTAVALGLTLTRGGASFPALGLTRGQASATRASAKPARMLASQPDSGAAAYHPGAR